MSQRRILLIDSDPEFQQRLQENFSPYGFEIHTAPENANSLSQVKDVGPEVIFIAVELPDKTGYSLCNKAKKGVAKEIPVVLTTASVPPSGFNSHRKLKVHADEYLDKRTLTDQELVDKLNALVGIGEAITGLDDDLDLPVDVEELEIDEVDDELLIEDLSDDIQVDDIQVNGSADEQDFDDGATRVAGPSAFMQIDGDVDDETEAAFAALGDFDGDEPPTEVLSDIDNAATMEAAAMEQAVSEPVGEPVAEPVGAPVGEELPQIEEDIDLGLDAIAELAEEEQSGIHDRGELNKLRELEAEIERLRGEVDAAKASSGDSEFSREREFLNLREVINKKEKEILDLRDEIGAKDRQILNGKERLQELEHTRADLEEKQLGMEQKILVANERAAGLDRAKKEGLAREGGLREQVSGLETELAAARQDIENGQLSLAQTKASSAAALEDANAQHAAAIEAAQNEHNSTLAALTRSNDAATEELQASHAAATAAAQQQAEQDQAAALQALRDEHSSELAALQKAHNRDAENSEQAKTEALEQAAASKAAALASAEERREEDVAAATARGAAELEAAREQHTGELAALTRAHDAEKQNLNDEHVGRVARLEQDKQDALAAAESKRLTDLEAAIEQGKQDVAAGAARAAVAKIKLEEEHTSIITTLTAQSEEELTAAEARRKGELASAAEERAASENALQEKYEGERAAMEQAHSEAVGALEAERTDLEKALAGGRERISQLETDLNAAQATIGQRDAEIEKQKDTVLARDSRIAALKQQQSELEDENTSYQEQVLKAYQKIKSDEEITGRAKKALAIALTLLDGESSIDGRAAVEDPVGDQ